MDRINRRNFFAVLLAPLLARLAPQRNFTFGRYRGFDWYEAPIVTSIVLTSAGSGYSVMDYAQTFSYASKDAIYSVESVAGNGSVMSYSFNSGHE